jgi:hypothetical protein
MNYEIVDIETGDVLAVYGAAAAAEQRARAFAEAHDELVQDIAVIAIDSNGHRVGEPHLVADLAEGREALA